MSYADPQKAREAKKRYAIEHPERMREASRRSREKRRGYCLLPGKASDEEKRAHRRVQQRLWRLNNPEKCAQYNERHKEQQRTRRAQCPEQVRSVEREYRLKNPDVVRIKAAKCHVARSVGVRARQVPRNVAEAWILVNKVRAATKDARTLTLERKCA